MSQKQALPYPLRIDDEYMAKLKVISKNNGRSVNKEIEVLIKKHINNYETSNGTIFLDQEG